MESRDYRRAELRALCAIDPEHLISMYREISPFKFAIEDSRQVSFTRMIESILDYEDEFGTAVDDALRSAAR